MSHRPTVVALLVCVAALSAAGATTTAATQSLIELDAPDEVTAGERATVTASASAPERPGDRETEVTVTFSVDGEQVDEETITVSGGESASVSFPYTFEAVGTRTVTVEGSGSVDGQTYTDSASATVEVVDPDSTPESTESTPESTESTPESTESTPDPTESTSETTGSTPESTEPTPGDGASGTPTTEDTESGGTVEDMPGFGVFVGAAALLLYAGARIGRDH